MKSFRNRAFLIACGLALAALAAWADLPKWLEHLPVVSRLEGAFFQMAPMPGGPVEARRLPQETRAALGQLISATPAEADLYAYRAHEAEEQLDFPAAEQDWKKFAALAADKSAGQLALADFYHRRLRPAEELGALDAAGAQGPASPLERFQPVEQQRSWRVFERAVELVQAQALPVQTGLAQYRAWTARYPKAQAAYQKYFDFAVAHKQFAAAEGVLAAYGKEFPEDAVFPVSARASLAEAQGAAEQALAVYDKAFQPLWPPALAKDYFALLARTHNLRRFLDRSRAAVAANPVDLNAAARIFYYYQQQGNLLAAHRALAEFRLRKEAHRSPFTTEELWTLARLFEGTQRYEDAIRSYYEMYALAGKSAGAERAMGGIIGVLFTAPEQPLSLGAGDLSFYKDIATMDPCPGFLNGILSLLLNSAYPKYKYADEDRASAAYFHRVRASELLELFDSRFPKSAERPALHSALLGAYATYGDSDGVIRGGREFLAAFPQAAERTEVAILMADAFARKDDTAREFATYDALLKELAAKADGMPLGEAGATGARSADYSRVLERYISRLVSLKRPLEALALLRHELDANPNDPGLYERLASFLQSTRMDGEVEQVYRRAIRQFNGTSWYEKLARWYIRQRQAEKYRQLTREVVNIFSGTDLEDYLKQMGPGSFGAAMYLEVNLYAHQRFPHDLRFVQNLLAAYTARDTRNPAEWEKLVRNYWYYDDALRVQFLQFLAASQRLDSELQMARAEGPKNTAAVRFVAEAEAWRSRFEAAAPAMDALAAVWPANKQLAGRAASLNRSLAAYDARLADKAAALEQKLHESDPRDHGALTRVGEIYADREQFGRSRPYWNKLAAIEPGKPDGYLEAATVFWDYYQFDDALRLIGEGRKKLGNPALYAYEAGAIYENKRDYERAIGEYVKGAEPNSAARARLLALAKRPAIRATIEKLTAAQAAGPDPSEAAVSLRVAVLEAQNRQQDMVQLLLGVADRTTSLEGLESIRNTASRFGLAEVEGRAIEREIAVAADPVERMQLQLALMRYYEGQKDLQHARKVVEALYAQNQEILGVVRAITDFYWRNKMETQAVDVLVRAAGAANAQLKKQFTIEAARKSTEAGDTGRARTLLAVLLQAEPQNPEYLTAMADTYARQGDDAGLRAFYTAKIREITDTNLKTMLRRGLIPVLERQKDYAGAVDEYIEILKNYPEDEGVARAAAMCAAGHGESNRLLAFFHKAVADSPRDFRWPMVMARLETFFENIPAAIASYSQALAIRPDRVDLYVARESLEERLMRFDEALATSTKLYELTYHDPRWMGKVAEIHARKGEKDAAAKALRLALIEGRPERPQPFFEAAETLDSWNLVSEARPFVERGVELAGDKLLVDSEFWSGARVYARVMTRLRAQEQAFARLTRAPGGETESVLNEMCDTVRRYFTPEEKASFQALLEKNAGVLQNYSSLPERAGLTDLESRWLFARMMASPGTPQSPVRQFIDLERRRMKFEDLARGLLEYWKVDTAEQVRDWLVLEAASAYRSAGDESGEFDALGLKEQSSGFGGAELGRYLELVLKRDPQRLITLAARGGVRGDGAANAAVASGDAALAMKVVAARGRSLAPVWTRAYTGLVGLYYADTAPPVDADFAAALGGGTIRERLGRRVDRNQQLAGSDWFYYGTAYGEYLAARNSSDAEDYLPALLEGAPARSGAYFTLAEYYRDRGDLNRAAADYEHTLALSPNRGDVEDRLAGVLWDQGKRAEAVAHWNAAFKAYRKTLDGRVPETFWSDVGQTLDNVGRRKLLAEVRADAEQVLRTYIRRNGEYRVEPLLEAAYNAAADPAAGVSWVTDLIRAASDPLPLYATLVNAAWLPEAQREPVYRLILNAAEAEAARLDSAHEYREDELRQWRIRWIEYLVDTKQPDRAEAELRSLPEAMRAASIGQVHMIEIRIAAHRGTVPQMLERYQREPDKAPRLELLRNAAAVLDKAGDAMDARKLLDFVYTRELQERNFTAANFLGLAEVRLEEGNANAAGELLRRMTLVADQPFDDLEPAADLLMKYGRNAEARPFLEARVKAVPWDLGARAKLGDASVATLPEAPYALRAQAAGLKPSGKTGSAELDLLAGGQVTPAAAGQPLFYWARVKAAESTQDANARIRLLMDAVGIDPDLKPARLALFRAALSSGRYQAAISSMERLVESGGLGSTDWAAERASIAKGLGLAYARTGRPAQAIAMYQQSIEIQADAQASAALQQLQAEEASREREALRRPVISSGLTQEHLVLVHRNGGKTQ